MYIIQTVGFVIFRVLGTVCAIQDIRAHDDVTKRKHFPRNRSPVNSPHKGRWRGALMFSLMCAWINGWVNNGEAGDSSHHRTHTTSLLRKIIINANLMISYFSITQSLWNFALSTTVILSRFVQNFKMIGHLKQRLCTNEISWLEFKVRFGWIWYIAQPLIV